MDKPPTRNARSTALWCALACCLPILNSCSTVDAQPGLANSNRGGKPTFRIDRPLYDRASPSETSINVSITDQVAQIRDKDGNVILETQISTGVPAHPTPPGRFEVLEKIVDKRSNLYGRYVNAQTGEIVVREAWKHQGKKPPGTVYRGIAMPYWMRLTWTGIGIHVGNFPAGYRSSHGCVRVPDEVQPLIFAKATVGTPVEIVP